VRSTGLEGAIMGAAYSICSLRFFRNPRRQFQILQSSHYTSRRLKVKIPAEIAQRNSWLTSREVPTWTAVFYALGFPQFSP
jgi:hypothetical protein